MSRKTFLDRPSTGLVDAVVARRARFIAYENECVYATVRDLRALARGQAPAELLAYLAEAGFDAPMTRACARRALLGAALFLCADRRAVVLDGIRQKVKTRRGRRTFPLPAGVPERDPQTGAVRWFQQADLQFDYARSVDELEKLIRHEESVSMKRVYWQACVLIYGKYQDAPTMDAALRLDGRDPDNLDLSDVI
jgi:hypothetical protein